MCVVFASGEGPFLSPRSTSSSSDPLTPKAILLRPTHLGSRKRQTKAEKLEARKKMDEYELQLDVKRRLKACVARPLSLFLFGAS